MRGYLSACFLVFGLFALLSMFWYYFLGRVSFLSNREKASSFECGFDGKDNSRIPLSLRFFFLLLLFLVFDIELTLLLQAPFLVSIIKWVSAIPYMLMFWTLLLFILEEVRRGLLKWTS